MQFGGGRSSSLPFPPPQGIICARASPANTAGCASPPSGNLLLFVDVACVTSSVVVSPVPAQNKICSLLSCNMSLGKKKKKTKKHKPQVWNMQINSWVMPRHFSSEDLSCVSCPGCCCSLREPVAPQCCARCWWLRGAPLRAPSVPSCFNLIS